MSLFEVFAWRKRVVFDCTCDCCIQGFTPCKDGTNMILQIGLLPSDLEFRRVFALIRLEWQEMCRPLCLLVCLYLSYFEHPCDTLRKTPQLGLPLPQVLCIL